VGNPSGGMERNATWGVPVVVRREKTMALKNNLDKMFFGVYLRFLQ
jgi:hypothetical protein